MVTLAVAATADVQPADTRATIFEEYLVEVQIVDDELIPAAPRLFVWQVDVGSLAVEVLRVAYAMYRLVEFWTAVAAIDMYRFALVVAQGLQHLAAEVAQVNHCLPVGAVVDAPLVGRLTLDKLFQSEVLRQLHLRIVLRFIHSVFVFGLCLLFLGGEVEKCSKKLKVYAYLRTQVRKGV